MEDNSSSHNLTLKEKYKTSLLAKMTLSMLKSSLVLGTVLFIIGLAIYIQTSLDNYITESFTLAKSAAVICDQITDCDDLASRMINMYRAVPEEVRQDQKSSAYRMQFDDLREEQEYKDIHDMLGRLSLSSNVDYLYFGVYDPKTQSLITIVDPDPNPETKCQPGEWEEVTDAELKAFTSWDGNSKLHNIGRSARHGYMCTSGYPVGDPDDELYAYVLADITLVGVIRGIRILIIEYAIAVILLLYLMGRRLNIRMTDILVNPINKIGEAAQKYVRDKSMGLTATDHFDNLGISTGDEIEQLSMIMADMEHSIGAHEEALVRLTAERERTHTELDLATRIQMNMLPSEFPAFPDHKEFDIYATMDPAREVGGDFYDFFLIDDNHLAIVMADVASKGVPAALFMMSSMIIVGNCTVSTEDYDPGKMLESANNLICSHNSTDMFVTMWLGILDLSTGLLRAANAGHEYPTVMHKGGKFELLKDKHGFVLGTMEDMKYTSYELQLEPGSRVFVYTDGVTEATDADEKMFGTDRMLSALNKAPEASPEDILKNVRHAVDKFVKDAPQFDDLTMLCIEFKGGYVPAESSAAAENGSGTDGSGAGAGTDNTITMPKPKKRVRRFVKPDNESMWH